MIVAINKVIKTIFFSQISDYIDYYQIITFLFYFLYFFTFLLIWLLPNFKSQNLTSALTNIKFMTTFTHRTDSSGSFDVVALRKRLKISGVDRGEVRGGYIGVSGGAAPAVGAFRVCCLVTGAAQTRARPGLEPGPTPAPLQPPHSWSEGLVVPMAGEDTLGWADDVTVETAFRRPFREGPSQKSIVWRRCFVWRGVGTWGLSKGVWVCFWTVFSNGIMNFKPDWSRWLLSIWCFQRNFDL